MASLNGYARVSTWIHNFCHLKGTVCDCGRYRKVVGQLDISVARLKTSMKFVKNGEHILSCFVLFVDLTSFSLAIPVFLARNTLGWAKCYWDRFTSLKVSQNSSSPLQLQDTSSPLHIFVQTALIEKVNFWREGWWNIQSWQAMPSE